MRALDRAHAFLFLQLGDALAEAFHFRPMPFWTEMMFGVIAVVEKKPVINLAIAAHPPGDRFVRIRAVVAILAVQITEAVSEVEKRQEIKNNVTPVEQKHDQKDGPEHGQLKAA